MADPFSAGTLMAVSAGTTAAGGILGAFGKSKEAEAKSNELKYKAGLARMNAEVMRRNAERTLDAGDRNARLSGINTGFTIAKQKTAQAASGFDVNEGMPADVREQTRKIGYEDQTTIRTEAATKAMGQRNQGAMLDAEAALDEKGAENALTAGKFSIASTLLGTAGSVASKWTSVLGGAKSTGITTYDENFMPTSFTAT